MKKLKKYCKNTFSDFLTQRVSGFLQNARDLWWENIEMEKKHEISEDDAKRGLERLQKITDECIKKAEKQSEIKEKDILNV